MDDWNAGLMRHLGMRFVEVGPAKGRRTHVWQTRVTDAAGRLLSLTIQTQMILDK